MDETENYDSGSIFWSHTDCESVIFTEQYSAAHQISDHSQSIRRGRTH